MDNFGIPSLTFSGAAPPEPPILLVLGPEKVGKSTTAISLFDYPFQGARPLVLAFDEAGVDSCAQLGYQVPCIKIGRLPGSSFWEKTQVALLQVEQAFQNRRSDFALTSIVVDCASTMADKFMQEASAKYTNQLQAYGAVKTQCTQVMWRLIELGVPTVWYSWLKEPYIEEKGSGQNKSKKTVMGGPLIPGNFKATLAGKATQILLLEKVSVGNVEGADPQGYLRRFHTRTYNFVNCEGRYSQYLPEPAPAHLGWIIHQIMTRGGQQQQAGQ